MNDKMTITKSEWEIDVKNTERELDAYRKILDGFLALQSLPENENGKYRLEIMRYELSVRRCNNFLQTLKEHGKQYE